MASSNPNRRWTCFSGDSSTAVEDDDILAAGTADLPPPKAGYPPPLTAAKRNFEYRWCTQAAGDKAAGTTVLGVLDGAEDRACLAVVDKDGMLANDQPAGARMVHMFTNEQGSGGSRRVFLAVTELGRLIFVRAAKWAMGEETPRYQSFRITKIKPASRQSITLSWESSARHNFNIQASTDFNNWQTVVDDLIGADGTLSSTLDIGAAPQTLFLRVGRLP